MGGGRADIFVPLQAEVGVYVAFSDLTLVFSEGNIQLPVRRVFDGPVPANGFGKLHCRQLSTKNVITTVNRFLPVT